MGPLWDTSSSVLFSPKRFEELDEAVVAAARGCLSFKQVKARPGAPQPAPAGPSLASAQIAAQRGPWPSANTQTARAQSPTPSARPFPSFHPSAEANTGSKKTWIRGFVPTMGAKNRS
eukprot:gene14336-20328_t